MCVEMLVITVVHIGEFVLGWGAAQTFQKHFRFSIFMNIC